MDACVFRPANGVVCARKFGEEFAQKHGRFPTDREVFSKLTHVWTARWKRRLVREAQQSAANWLNWNSASSLRQYAELLTKVQKVRPFFESMGVSLDVAKTATKGRWTIHATFPKNSPMNTLHFYSDDVSELINQIGIHSQWDNHCKLVA